jgi:hypothetical protein
MTTFTPIASLAGGILIGLSATILMGLNGRVAGVSGITAGLMSFKDMPSDWAWRFAFVAGIVAAPLAMSALGLLTPTISFPVSIPSMAVAGVMVGFGTVLGNGCTSGHGVCGVARLSTRSLIATGVFLTAGIATVYVLRHLV